MDGRGDHVGHAHPRARKCPLRWLVRKLDYTRRFWKTTGLGRRRRECSNLVMHKWKTPWLTRGRFFKTSSDRTWGRPENVAVVGVNFGAFERPIDFTC